MRISKKDLTAREIRGLLLPRERRQCFAQPSNVENQPDELTDVRTIRAVWYEILQGDKVEKRYFLYDQYDDIDDAQNKIQLLPKSRSYRIFKVVEKTETRTYYKQVDPYEH